jgi:hypothetical protein
MEEHMMQQKSESIVLMGLSSAKAKGSVLAHKEVVLDSILLKFF